MMQVGINTRVGPICRTVEDAAKILDVIAGYDPSDELTAFGIGRRPPQPYPTFAHATRLDGLRIGVVREYMNKTLFTKADEQTIDIVSAAVGDLQKLGATIVDPGPEGDLFTNCFKKYGPADQNILFTKQFPQLFPVDDKGKPKGDDIAKLLELAADPSKVPDKVTIRDFGPAQAEGESKYWLDRYLQDRGDANIKTNVDLMTKARFHNDPNFPDRKKTRETTEKARSSTWRSACCGASRCSKWCWPAWRNSTSTRWSIRPAIWRPPSSEHPPDRRSTAAPACGVSSASRVFRIMTVPAGFTTETYDLIRDPSAPLTEYPAGRRPRWRRRTHRGRRSHSSGRTRGRDIAGGHGHRRPSLR